MILNIDVGLIADSLSILVSVITLGGTMVAWRNTKKSKENDANKVPEKGK